MGTGVPGGLGEVGEALALGEGEHGFGLGGVEGGLVGLAEAAVQQLGLLHSSKRIIIGSFWNQHFSLPSIKKGDTLTGRVGVKGKDYLWI
jgi:hypothetical protein